MELAKVQKLFATLFEAGELSWRQYDRLLAETMKAADAAKAQPHSPQQANDASLGVPCTCGKEHVHLGGLILGCRKCGSQWRS